MLVSSLELIELKLIITKPVMLDIQLFLLLLITTAVLPLLPDVVSIYSRNTACKQKGNKDTSFLNNLILHFNVTVLSLLLML